MDLGPVELRRPAREIARRLGLDLVTEASRARPRLGKGEQVEALHDFRVGLRRLRTILRAYRPRLRGSVGKKARRRLARVAQATGESRDLDVHLAWLAAQQSGLTLVERAGILWFLKRLRARKRKADAALADAVTHRFAKLRDRLEDGLGEYTVRLRGRKVEEELSFAGATEQLLREYGGELRRRLVRVRSIADQLPAHEARIYGKRLRYLLEPLAAAIPAAARLVEQLRALQDKLGDLHDAHVFAPEIAAALADAAAEYGPEPATPGENGAPAPAPIWARRVDPRPGLLAVAARLRERSEQTFTALEQSGWIGPGAGARLGLLDHVCEALEGVKTNEVAVERKDPRLGPAGMITTDLAHSSDTGSSVIETPAAGAMQETAT